MSGLRNDLTSFKGKHAVSFPPAPLLSSQTKAVFNGGKINTLEFYACLLPFLWSKWHARLSNKRKYVFQKQTLITEVLFTKTLRNYASFPQVLIKCIESHDSDNNNKGLFCLSIAKPTLIAWILVSFPQNKNRTYLARTLQRARF